MKSFEPMISAPLNCSDRRPSVVHPLAADRQPTAADVQHERNAALGQPGPERIVVGMAGRSASRRAGGEPHEAEAHVERGVELDDRPLRFVEVADRDAVEPIGHPRRSRPSLGCARGTRRIGAPASSISKSGAQNDEYTT